MESKMEEYYEGRQHEYSRDFSSKEHRVGLALIGTAGLSSAISTFLLLSYIGWYGFFSKNVDAPLVRGLRSFARSALGVFLVCLLLCDMLQGAAFAINYKWSADGRMYHSATCDAQGAVSQVGDSGAAIWSLAIAGYTFCLLFLFQKPPLWLTRSVFVAGWTVIIVLPVLGPYVIQDIERHGYFYGLSGAWCWLGDGYQLERFLYLYMFIFTSLGSSIVMYSMVYLRFSGRLKLENGKLVWNAPEKGWGLNCFSSWALRTNTSSSNQISGGSGSNDTRQPNSEQNGEVGKHLKNVARRLMLYPFVYSIVTIPVAICRLGVMAGWTPPFWLYVFAGITFSSSGLTNVFLFIATRHSFIQKVATRPRVHVTTHQVTVLEDARGAQTIHLHDFSSTTPLEDPDTASEKDMGDIEGEDRSVKSKHRSDGVVNPSVSVGVRFAGRQ